MVFGAYMLVGIWQNNQSLRDPSAAPRSCYEVRDPLDLAAGRGRDHRRLLRLPVVERAPAKIFMGDTGSLALGGALAGFAIMTRTELLLVVLGGLFVIDHAVGDPAGRLLQAARDAASGSSGWRRSSTTSSSRAGPRSRS